jgi:hypothetical protein
MSTAEEATTHFYAVPDDPALAVLTDRGNGLNCTLKAVECVVRSSRNQLESLVVFITADFAFRHVAPPLRANRAPLV